MVRKNNSCVGRSLNIMPPFLESLNDSQQFSIINFAVPFGGRKHLRNKRAWMSVSVRVQLGQDGSRCIFQCITLNLKWLCLIWYYQHRFTGESFFQVVKCLLAFDRPFKFPVHLQEVVKRSCYFRKSLNEPSIEVSKP